MMSSRFALIIESSNVAGEADLPGARADARNWESFLMSNLGGAWNENEILVRHKPSAEYVRRTVSAHSDGYVFLVFSGHGGLVFDRVTMEYQSCICLNDSERNVRIDSIAPSNNGTAVFDCCRGEPRSDVIAKCGHVLNEAVALDAFANESRAEAAAKAYIRACYRDGYEKGIGSLRTRDPVYMFACAGGGSAGEDLNAGGYYTSQLIASAHVWESAHLRGSGIVVPGFSVLSTLDVHRMARRNVEAKTKGKQVPEYFPVSQEYPFAIRLCVGG